MKVRMRLLMIASFFVFFCSVLYAKEISISIKGNFTGKNLNGKILRLEYYNSYSDKGIWRYSISKETKIVGNKINVKLVGVRKVGYLKIIIPDSKFNRFNDIPFLVESGDRIDFGLLGDSIKFIGEYANKMSCQIEISNIRPMPLSAFVSDSAYCVALKKSYQKAADSKLKKLNSCKSYMNKLFYNILSANINYGVDYSVLYSLRFARRNDTAAYVSAPKYFKEFIATGQPKEVDPITGLNSISYIDYQLEKQLCFLEMPQSGIERPKYESVYRQIDSSYTGPIRDRVLYTSLFTTFTLDNSMDYYINKILSNAKDYATINELKNYLAILGKGAKFQDFHLRDTLNKVVSLSDFRGKALIVDFYFTGCIGCAKLTTAMAPIFTQYKDNPNVAFLSICVDKDFNMFKRAVKSRLYTHEGEVNLYTNGEGMQHLVARAYVPSSAPVLMLVDKIGNIYNGALPFPFDATAVNSLKEYIDGAIKSSPN